METSPTKKWVIIRWVLLLPNVVAAFVIPIVFLAMVFHIDKVGTNVYFAALVRCLSGIFSGFALVRVGANTCPLQNKRMVAIWLIILASFLCVVGSIYGIMDNNWAIFWLTSGTIPGMILSLFPNGSVTKAIKNIIKDD